MFTPGIAIIEVGPSLRRWDRRIAHEALVRQDELEAVAASLIITSLPSWMTLKRSVR